MYLSVALYLKKCWVNEVFHFKRHFFRIFCSLIFSFNFFVLIVLLLISVFTRFWMTAVFGSLDPSLKHHCCSVRTSSRFCSVTNASIQHWHLLLWDNNTQLMGNTCVSPALTVLLVFEGKAKFSSDGFVYLSS